MTNGRQLVNELRRRHVVRAVVVYWVAAWTCIEVSSVVEQALMLPEWIDQTVVILAAAGLPVVIATSWLFEWGPQGLVADDRDFAGFHENDMQHEMADRIANEVYRRLTEERDHGLTRS